ncbi:hypothetical protein H261_18427 [Paramagnetospirillum caucaseum]|uniref:Uncharacterized protein n=1 Tax=Paramagnetospirillum caucaseum TaxID=1244869 RepID=M3A7F1_9PROT|nr:hypothetical protein H261_18427 [Paramagnetospirillum caucaseum]
MIKVDSGTGLALLVVRDGDTGKEVEQYPSRQVVEEYKRNIPTAIDHPQASSARAPAAEDVKAPPAPVSAAPSAPAPAAAPAPTGGSIKI